MLAGPVVIREIREACVCAVDVPEDVMSVLGKPVDELEKFLRS